MLLAAVLLVGVTVGVGADPTANVSSPPALTPDTVLASLNASIDWYRQARVTMPRGESLGGGTVRPRGSGDGAPRRCSAAICSWRAPRRPAQAAPDPATKPPAQERLGRARARSKPRSSRGAARVAWSRARARGARRRLERNRARLSVMTKLQSFNASLAGTRRWICPADRRARAASPVWNSRLRVRGRGRVGALRQGREPGAERRNLLRESRRQLVGPPSVRAKPWPPVDSSTLRGSGAVG